MSNPTNGDPVTWRELNLALDPIKDDVKEVKHEITELRADLTASKLITTNRAFLGARGVTVANGLLIAVPAGLVSALVAFFH